MTTHKASRPYVLLAGTQPIGNYSTEQVARHALDLLANCTPGLDPGWLRSLSVGVEVPAPEPEPSPRPDTQGYNGWTNHETWALALHLDNSQHTYEWWRNYARECLTGAWELAEESDGEPWTQEGVLNEAVSILVVPLEEDVEDTWSRIENAATGVGVHVSRDEWLMFCDVGTHLGLINFREIARHWVDEVAES